MERKRFKVEANTWRINEERGAGANKWWNGRETRHTEQKLDATTNTGLERSSNPGVCEAGVLTNKDHLTEEKKRVRAINEKKRR